MQLGRSYSRRLKSVKYEIYELYPSARHAYNIIRPAVKTSRPHGIPGKVGISFIKELFFSKILMRVLVAVALDRAFGSRFPINIGIASTKPQSLPEIEHKDTPKSIYLHAYRTR